MSSCKVLFIMMGKSVGTTQQKTLLNKPPRKIDYKFCIHECSSENSRGKLMLSGNEESMMKLSVISPNTTHKRGSVVPLTIAITDPIKMSNLSQPSAKRNYTRKHQRQRCSSQRPRVTDGAVSKRPRKVGVWKSEQINRVGRGKLSICCIGLVLKNFKWFIKKKNT